MKHRNPELRGDRDHSEEGLIRKGFPDESFKQNFE